MPLKVLISRSLDRSALEAPRCGSSAGTPPSSSISGGFPGDFSPKKRKFKEGKAMAGKLPVARFDRGVDPVNHLLRETEN
jgi:hypothetical protein